VVVPTAFWGEVRGIVTLITWGRNPRVWVEGRTRNGLDVEVDARHSDVSRPVAGPLAPSVLGRIPGRSFTLIEVAVEAGP
jgi:hypothetical protein